MNKLILLILIISSLFFVSAPIAKADVQNQEQETDQKKIILGSLFIQRKFPYEYQGKIEDTKSEVDLCIFEFDLSKDGYIYVGIHKESKLILFYHFLPKNIKVDDIIKNFGREFQIVPNGIFYPEIGFFAEIDSKKNVVMVGKFLMVKDV